jgi:HPt (histidine-containing phosphotransfer) domain-containing protein
MAPSDGSLDPVEALWIQFRPLVRQRIDLIAAHLDGDPAVSRTQAARAAHNLGGSLGSYGRSKGSAIARRIDLALTDGAFTVDPSQLRAAVVELRSVLDV